MKRYVIYRISALIPVVFLVSIIVFFLVNVLPGDPVSAMFGPGAGISEEVLDDMREELGLDHTLPERYVMWLSDIVRGDLGTSIRTGEPVSVAIARAFPATLWLAGASFAIALAIALPIGILAAGSSHRRGQNLAKTFSLVGISIPSFVFGIGLILIFAIKLGWLPAIGYTPPSEDVWLFLKSLALPAITEGVNLGAILSIAVYHNVAQELSSDYVRTARSKGLPRGLILRRHVLRNALVGIAGVAGWLLIAEIGGTIVIETLFAVAGLGSPRLERRYRTRLSDRPRDRAPHGLGIPDRQPRPRYRSGSARPPTAFRKRRRSPVAATNRQTLLSLESP